MKLKDGDFKKTMTRGELIQLLAIEDPIVSLITSVVFDITDLRVEDLVLGHLYVGTQVY